MTPKLSIIVPVYNTEVYLRECLDSIINQTFKDIEIIIVNDCSPDNSEAIILEYQQKDPRIKYIKHEKNLGLGGARNTGITNAIGEWIAFVDSDDYIDLNTYKTMLSLMGTHQANLGTFSVVNFDDTTKEETHDSYFDGHADVLTTMNHQKFYTVPSTTAWNKIFKRSDLIDNNLTFPEHLKHEDEEFWFKYIAIVEPSVISCNEQFYHYRQRSTSIMSNSSSRLDLPQVLFNIYTFLKQHNLLETYKTIFIAHLIDYMYFYKNFSNKVGAKHLQEIKNVLDLLQLTSSELQQDSTMFFVNTLEQITEDSIVLLSQLQTPPQENQNIQYDKWYVFGQLSRKQKIKKIIVVISKKLKIYPILKYVYKIVRK